MLCFGNNPTEVDPAKNLPVGGRNAGDAIRLPDIRVNLTVHPLQFIELGDGFSSVLDCDSSNFFERARIPHADIGGTVAHVDLFTVIGEAPSFTVVAKTAKDAHRGF